MDRLLCDAWRSRRGMRDRKSAKNKKRRLRRGASGETEKSLDGHASVNVTLVFARAFVVVFEQRASPSGARGLRARRAAGPRFTTFV